MLYFTSATDGVREILMEKDDGQVEMKGFSVEMMNERWFDVAATGGAVQVRNNDRIDSSGSAT
jgi:hypothetical protein